MGCFQSKKDCGDIHPNVFRVVNIDEGGNDLWSGQLEITETDLILYRDVRDATVWPLASLRRYGFDGDIFSFESGRRCATGEGIYAFRCRRAGMLFRTLQQNIQIRNVIHESLPFQIPANIMNGSPQTLPRQTLQASVVHRSSVDNGQPNRNTIHTNHINGQLPAQSSIPQGNNQSPRSPSSADILEVMPLYPRPQNASNQVTNVYQLKDFKCREHNNNQEAQGTEGRHLYSNDLNRELAVLRNTLRQEAALNTIRDIEDETQFLQSRYLNESIPLNRGNQPLSPTLSNASEHYAQLTIEQEQARQYMNIVPSDILPDMSNKCDTVPSTPLTPKQPEYCNFNLNIVKQEMNSYANLSLGDMADSVNNTKILTSSSGENQKYSESDTFTSMSPVEELEVNYAILDIDANKDDVIAAPRALASPESQCLESTTSHCSNQSHGRNMSDSSLDNVTTMVSLTAAPSVGYTTIDFDKTVALTSVAACTDIDVDGSRKTRHNSNSGCGSPISPDKNRS